MNQTILASLFVVSLLFQAPIIFAQPGRLTEKDVNQQKLMIDASREKMLGNYDAAIALLKDVLKEDDNNAAAAYELSRVYAEVNNLQGAVETAQKSVAAAPDNIWYQRLLLDLYQQLNKNDEAAAVAETIVKLEPGDDFNYYRWAYFLVRAGDVKKAVKVYDQLEGRSGINEEIVRRKHSLYLGIGDYKKAASELERLINTFPRDVDYRHLLASFYEQIDEKAKAQKVYEEILKIDPDNVKAQLALSGKPGGATDEEQFISTLKPVFKQPDVSIDMKLARIIPIIQKAVDTEDEQLARALLELTSILEEVHPSDPKSYAASADLLYYAGDKEAALEKYKQALALDDTIFLLWEQSMRIMDYQGGYTELLPFSEKAMDFFPNQAIAYYFYAKAAFQLGDAEEAVSILPQAKLMAGRNLPIKHDIQILYGLASNQLGNYEQADEAFTAMMEEDDSNPFLLAGYAYMLALRGQQLKEATIMAEQASKLLGAHALPIQAQAMIAFKEKNHNKAKELMQSAITLEGAEAPIFLEEYGDILFEAGDTNTAIQYWKKAKDKGRVSKELDKKIATHSN